MKVAVAIVASSVFSLGIAQETGPAWTDSNYEPNQPQLSTEIAGGFTGDTQDKQCAKKWNYKAGPSAEAESVEGCVSVTRYEPFKTGATPALGETDWCFTGTEEDNYNPTNDLKKQDWAYCKANVRFVTAGGEVPNGTHCAYRWNYNKNDRSPVGVLDSCISYTADTAPNMKNIDPSSVPDIENKKWCYTGNTKGYNPEQTSPSGQSTDKSFEWGWCVDTLATPAPTPATDPTTAPPTPATDPTTAPPTPTSDPTTASPTASPTKDSGATYIGASCLLVIASVIAQVL